MNAKVCTKCNTEKPVAEFCRYSKAPDGYRACCKECMKPYFQEYYQKNKQRTLERTRAYNRTPKAMEAARQRGKRNHARKRHDPEYRQRAIQKVREWTAKSPRAALHRSLSNALKRRPTENPATIKSLVELWKQQQGKCAVTGIEMVWCKGRTLPESMSIDRIDQTKGYEIGNVRLVCYQVNTFRGRWSDEQMVEMATRIIANLGMKLASERLARESECPPS
jgi:hypothetical protein